ncbi:uncharacterized protein BROUX77_006184 [Berkeleyomyces rouxiae]|uniref:uncharacterized protein n=1 Tax=Berkeleyomyces rouxiae TaxID=2035830 RepID=UPI003B7A59C1
MNRTPRPADRPADSSPARPVSAPVIEFLCLFSHDLKRKQKRWKDGRLKFHTFNKRVMVYDDRGNSIGDMHWQESFPFQEGEEINLDRGGVVVQVCECKGHQEQDLTELLSRRPRPAPPPPENAAATPLHNRLPRRTPATGFNPPRPAAQAPNAAASPSLLSRARISSFQTPSGGPIGRAVLPRSPFEERQAQLQDLSAAPAESPAPKRRRYEQREQKSAYATSLFGAALNLSATSTPPASVRQKPIPRLHSVNPSAQVSSSVTSLRASYRDTRPRSDSNRASTRERLPDFVQTPAPAREPISINRENDTRARAESVSREPLLSVEASVAPPTPKTTVPKSTLAPAPSRPQARSSSETSSIEILHVGPRQEPQKKPKRKQPKATTGAAPKRTRDPSPDITPARPEKRAKERADATPEESQGKSTTFSKSRSNNRVPPSESVHTLLPPASQPRVELRLQSRRKRKGLMISAAPAVVVAPLRSPSLMDLAVDEALMSKEVNAVTKKDEQAPKKPPARKSTVPPSPNMLPSSVAVAPLQSPSPVDLAVDEAPILEEVNTPTRKDRPVPKKPPAKKSAVPPSIDKPPPQVHIILSSSPESSPSALSDHTPHDIPLAADLPSRPASESCPQPHRPLASPVPEPQRPPASPVPAADALEIPQSPLPPSDHSHPSSPTSPLSPPTVLPPDAFSRRNYPSSLLRSESPVSEGLDEDDVVGISAQMPVPTHSSPNSPNPDCTDDLDSPSLDLGVSLEPTSIPTTSEAVPKTVELPKTKTTESSLEPSTITKTKPTAKPPIITKTTPATRTVSEMDAIAEPQPPRLPGFRVPSFRNPSNTTTPASRPAIVSAASLSRMPGFLRPEVTSADQSDVHRDNLDRGQHGNGDGHQAAKHVLPPVRRFPGFTRASGDPWSREAYDLFEWSKPCA